MELAFNRPDWRALPDSAVKLIGAVYAVHPASPRRGIGALPTPIESFLAVSLATLTLTDTSMSNRLPVHDSVQNVYRVCT